MLPLTRKFLSQRLRLPAICLALLTIGTPAASACTLFAANGPDWVQGGGTLIAKNRDWKPEWQEMRLNEQGTYRFYGIYTGDAQRMQLRGGVNEKGLAVLSASASAIPKRERMSMPQAAHSALRTLLSDCASVDEALCHTELWLGPKFLLLADADKIACIEIAPEGVYRLQVLANAPLVHTNHYLEPDLIGANERIGPSSAARYARMSALLQDGPLPYELQDFIRFSQDQADGPDNSIWRTGSRTGSEQTLASLVFHLQKGQTPEIYVKIRYAPDEQGQEDVFTIDGSQLFAK